jgi:hypothetical protein
MESNMYNVYMYKHLDILKKEVTDDNEGLYSIFLLLKKIQHCRKEAIDRSYKGLALIVSNEENSEHYIYAEVDLVIKMHAGLLTIIKNRTDEILGE